MGVKEMSRRIIIPVVPRNMFLQNCSCRMVILSLTQRKIPLAFFSARAHWWLMFNTVPIRTPSLPAKLLSGWAAPGVYWCRGLFLPSFRNSFYWTSWGCSQPLPAAGEGPSGWQHDPLVYQLHLPVYYLLGNIRKTLSYFICNCMLQSTCCFCL